jgi:hypothetical protein
MLLDTCIQLTDGGFPNGHPQVARCDSAEFGKKSLAQKKKSPNPI